MNHLTRQELQALLPRIELVDPQEIILHPNNPRTLSEKRFKELVRSVESFWQMLFLRPVVLNEDGVALGGNMKTLASRKAGFKVIPVLHAEHLTPQQQREFIVKDNVHAGDWDMEALANNWDQDLLLDWGFQISAFQAPPLMLTHDDIGSQVHGSQKTPSQDSAPSFNLVVRCQDENERRKIQDLLEQEGLIQDEHFYHV